MIEPDRVRAAQRGDTVAMNEVLDALTPYVGKICGPIALDDGPDAAQEALIAIFRRLRTLENPAALFGWARALAAGVPGAAVTERVLPQAPEQVKAMLADLEVFAEIQADLVAATLLERDGDHVVVQARGARGQRARLKGQFRPGWCWLQSRFVIIGMAVAAEPGGGTRVALTGGIRVPGRAAIVPIRVRQESSKTLDRLERLLRA